MSILTECPKPTALTAIADGTCPIDFDQLLKGMIQRKQATVPFADLTEIQTQSNWDTFIAASDATKIIQTPIMSEVVIPNSEGKFEGGDDNSTPYGVRIYLGENTVTVTGMFRSLEATRIAAMRKLAAESLSYEPSSTLSIYLVNRDGKLVCHKNAGGAHFGIPLYNFRVSSIGSEGLDAKNKCSFSFDLRPNWDELVTVVTPTFDPLAFLS